VINYPCDEISVTNCCVVECIVIKWSYIIPLTDKPINIQTSAKTQPFLRKRDERHSFFQCCDASTRPRLHSLIVRTLSDVCDRADRYGDVVKSGRVVCRVVSVEATTSLNHMTLIARLLTRLHGRRITISMSYLCYCLNNPCDVSK